MKIAIAACASLGIILGGAFASAAIQAQSTTAHARAAATHRPVVHNNGPRILALTSAECTQLGGSVETNTTCGGGNKQCRTTTVASTGTITTHTLCIMEQ